MQARSRRLGCATSVDLGETLGWLALRGSDLVADLTATQTELAARRASVTPEITTAIEALALAVVAIRDAQHRAQPAALNPTLDTERCRRTEPPTPAGPTSIGPAPTGRTHRQGGSNDCR